MIQKKDKNNAESAETEKQETGSRKWLIFAVGSAVFASLTSILGKIGIQDVNSNLGTAIWTIVVFCNGMDCRICDRKTKHGEKNR